MSRNPDKKKGTLIFYVPRHVYYQIHYRHQSGKKNDKRQRECKKRGENESWIVHGPSSAAPLLPNNIYASARSPDKVMDSRGDFACA